tara:strand:- start:15730 stop:16053 length:324 start_codon:yes stop_codon:yes gene_type:complete
MSAHDLQGFDNNHFASFSRQSDDTKVEQLPSVPIDDVLPKVDESIQKKVQFDDEKVDESLHSILPEEPKEETKIDVFQQLCEMCTDNWYFFVAIIILLLAFLYSRYY